MLNKYNRNILVYFQDYNSVLKTTNTTSNCRNKIRTLGLPTRKLPLYYRMNYEIFFLYLHQTVNMKVKDRHKRDISKWMLNKHNRKILASLSYKGVLKTTNNTSSCKRNHIMLMCFRFALCIFFSFEINMISNRKILISTFCQDFFPGFRSWRFAPWLLKLCNNKR